MMFRMSQPPEHQELSPNSNSNSLDKLTNILNAFLQATVPDRELASAAETVNSTCAPVLVKPRPAPADVRTIVQGNEQIQFVLSTFMPTLVRHLLRPGAVYSLESASKIGDFLLTTVELCHCTIFTDSLEMLNVLILVLGAPYSDSPTSFVSFYEQKRDGVSNTQYLVAAVQKFIELEGPNQIMARIEDTSRPLSMPSLHLLLSSIHLVRGYLPKNGLDQFLFRLQDAVFESLLRAPPESLKRMTKQTMAKPLALIDALMAIIIGGEEIRRRNEIFDLSFGLALLKCPFLDKRIQGINDIKDLIERSLKKDEQTRKAKGAMQVLSAAIGVGPQEPLERISLTSAFLVDWLEKNEVCKILLDPVDEHVELVRRSYEVFKLFLSENRLSTFHLDMLWTLASSGKHESVEHLVYDTVKKLAPLLSRAQRDHLLQCIAEKPAEEYDLQLIALVRDFSLATFKMGDHLKPAKGDDTQWLGLKLLYKIARVTATPVGHLPASSNAMSSALAPPAESLSPASTSSTIAPAEPTPNPASPVLAVINPNHYPVPLPSQVDKPTNKTVPFSRSRLKEEKKLPKLKRDSSVASEIRVTAEVSKVAMDYFLELLGSDFTISQREIYLERCIVNLSKSMKVPRTITFLSSIIHLYPSSSTKDWLSFGSKDTQKQIVDSLQEKYNLIALVLQDLSLYMAQIQSLVQGTETKDASKIESDGSGLNHQGQLKLRAEFLSFLFKNSSTAIGPGALKIIWETLVVGSMCPAESERCCIWLAQAIKDGSLSEDGL